MVENIGVLPIKLSIIFGQMPTKVWNMYRWNNGMFNKLMWLSFPFFIFILFFTTRDDFNLGVDITGPNTLLNCTFTQPWPMSDGYVSFTLFCGLDYYSEWACCGPLLDEWVMFLRWYYELLFLCGKERGCYLATKVFWKRALSRFWH